MKKLIETDFPFARLSLVAERESWRKEVHRPVYYLHKWWARRLGSVFRGMVLASCADDTEEFWEHYYRKNDFGETIVLDPFMGSGVTIGEALKLGCRAIGRDINPVSYMMCRAAFSRYDTREVRRTYRRLEESLASRVLHYFRTRTSEEEDATVLYYFLVKGTTCPKCDNHIDLFKTRIFSKAAIPSKDPSARALCPGCGSIVDTRYDARTATCSVCSVSFDPQRGNLQGARVQCDGCGRDFRLVDRMKALDGPLDFRRYAKMILTASGAKKYETMNDLDRQVEEEVRSEYRCIAADFPIVRIQPGHNTNQMLKHNYRYWHQLFTDRQLVCIRHIMDGIRGIENPETRQLFVCLFSGVLEFNNLFASFKGEGTGAVRHMFSHHVLKPEAMPLEANIWGTEKSSGAFSSLFRSRIERALAYKEDPGEIQVSSGKTVKVAGINRPLHAEVTGTYKDFASNARSVFLSCGDSASLDLPDRSVDIVVTDPPFFDNVHYSELADFFFYWLRQLLDSPSPITTRSPAEVQDADVRLFTEKLTAVFGECRRVLCDDGLLVFTYHHARHEGWTAVHRAIRHSGFLCTQAYPIKAEMSVSMPLQKAKSPIHLDLILVCKKDDAVVAQPSCERPFHPAIRVAEEQVAELKAAGIAVSLADAKVVLMGRLLCELHKMCDLDAEEQLLKEAECGVDEFVSQVVAAEGEALYAAPQQSQLMLFEEIGAYLTGKGF